MKTDYTKNYVYQFKVPAEQLVAQMITRFNNTFGISMFLYDLIGSAKLFFAQFMKEAHCTDVIVKVNPTSTWNIHFLQQT